MEKSFAPGAESSSGDASASEQTSSPTNVDSRTSSQAATRARITPTPADQRVRSKRLQAINSSALLSSLCRHLFYAKTRPQYAQMRLGLGTGFDPNWNDWITLSSPFDSGRVALALSSDGTDCSCSPNMRAPNARDWKGMSAKSWRERKHGDTTPTLPDQIGGTPHPEYVEELMGFPIGWTDLED